MRQIGFFQFPIINSPMKILFSYDIVPQKGSADESRYRTVQTGTWDQQIVVGAT